MLKNKMEILKLLKGGMTVRMLDGRCGGGFVDTTLVQRLVDEGEAELFDNQGVQFARQATKPLTPSMSVLVKLGSIAVHVEEMFSIHGHRFDKAAIETLLDDPELKQWIEAMTELALLPVKRVRK